MVQFIRQIKAAILQGADKFIVADFTVLEFAKALHNEITMRINFVLQRLNCLIKGRGRHALHGL